MGRGATKARGNPWYEARIEAAKRDPRFGSRESTAEILDMSVSALEEAETGKHKAMPPDKALLMSEAYGAPELLRWFCLHECPIGNGWSFSCDVLMIDRVTVKLTKILRKDVVQWLKHTLQDIANDGVVSEDELSDLDEVVGVLKDLARIITELEIIRDRRRKE